MNLKHLIIFIVVLLIVLVSYLILNKRDQFYFQGQNIICNQIQSEYACGLHANNCAYKVDRCTDICRFNPANADENNFESFMMTSQGTGDNVEYFFENEEENGIFSECFNKCREIDRENSIALSECETSDCQSKCSDYLRSRVERIGTADIRFTPYPTNRLEQVDYNTLKDTIVTEMVGDFRQNIQDTIFQDSINTEISEQVNLEEEAVKLNNVISVLKNLNSTGNNFIQQVDQLGEFQDKYSQKIEDLLEEKKNTDTNLDLKISSLQNKLEELNGYYNQFNSDVNTNRNNENNSIYRSVECLANGKSLNLVPVNYRKEDNTYANYRNGVYCLTVTRTTATGNETGFVYVEPMKLDPDSDDTPAPYIYCNPYDTGCSYQLNMRGATRDNGPLSDAPNILEIDLGNNENVLSQRYPQNPNYSPLDFQFKKHAYFHVKEITSNDEYNSVLISTPSGTSNLISNEQIKYPFFVIESVESPGYLINVTNNPTSGFNLELKPANKGGTEKFKVSSRPSSDANCIPPE